MLKKIFSIALLLVLLCSCGGNSATLDIDGTVDALRESTAFPEAMVELEAHTAFQMYRLADYGVSEEDVEHCRVFVPQSVISDEMAFFQTTSEDTAKLIADAFAARVKVQAASFSGYGPDQVPKLNDAIIKQDGCFVYLIVAEDYEAVQTVLK